MNYFIIVFKNTHDAMNAEKILEQREVEIRIMPTPTQITQSCGICIRMEGRESIDTIIKSEIVQFKNIYEKCKDGYIQIK